MDKNWVTTALKNSSTVKNCLCRKQIRSKIPNDEIRYKNTIMFSGRLLMLPRNLIDSCEIA
jgi:hypothetical protein